jgi:hypothetical protein
MKIISQKKANYSMVVTIIIFVVILASLLLSDFSPKTITKGLDSMIISIKEIFKSYMDAEVEGDKFPAEYIQFEKIAYEFILVVDNKFETFDYDKFIEFEHISKDVFEQQYPINFMDRFGCFIKGYTKDTDTFEEPFLFEPNGKLGNFNGILSEMDLTSITTITATADNTIIQLLNSKPKGLLCAKIDAGKYYYWFKCTEEFSKETKENLQKNVIKSDGIEYQCKKVNGEYEWTLV